MFMRINGKDVPSENGTWLDVKNPATGESVGMVPDGTGRDIDAAVDAAVDAFPGWSSVTMRERGILLFRAAEIVRKRHQEIGRLLTLEQGKPVREAVDEVRGFANILEFYAGLSSRPSGDAIRLGRQGDCITIREPLGVCGAVIPWNMPVLILGWKTAPALLAGNTTVVKPSRSTPLATLTLAAVMEEAGIPPGVLNIVTGRGETAGEALISHPSVGKISFTGSCETGCRVKGIAAGKDLTLELGGSDPMVVMDDADIRKAVEGAIRGRFYNAGQTCTAVKRLFIHENIAEPFISLLTDRVGSLKIGNGLDSATDMGPLHSHSQRESIRSVVESALENGEGTLETGGKIPESDAYRNGFYYLPTIVSGAPPDSRLMREEVFGPVLPVTTFPDLERAVKMANTSRYGLGASIWTDKTHAVRTFFDTIHAGVVWVNRHLTVPPEIPFGGMQESGSGRENGFAALDGYTRTKTLFIGW
jgi:acyl-CoA reductase-like NAD-dependent aldehyde dehydrogenase